LTLAAASTCQSDPFRAWQILASHYFLTKFTQQDFQAAPKTRVFWNFQRHQRLEEGRHYCLSDTEQGSVDLVLPTRSNEIALAKHHGTTSGLVNSSQNTQITAIVSRPHSRTAQDQLN
jgi:hypothetical protein